MIDSLIYKFFGLIDSLSEKLEEVLTFQFPNCQKKKKNKKK